MVGFAPLLRGEAGRSVSAGRAEQPSIRASAQAHLGVRLGIADVEGDTIAHGQPRDATGTVLTTCRLHAMKRDGIRRGLVTLCIGGGQGIALALGAV